MFDAIKNLLTANRVLASAGRTLARELVDVGPGNKRLLPSAGDHDHPDRIILTKRLNSAIQLVERFEAHRVEHRRTVDRDGCNRTVALEQEVLELVEITHGLGNCEVYPVSSGRSSRGSWTRAAACALPNSHQHEHHYDTERRPQAVREQIAKVRCPLGRERLMDFVERAVQGREEHSHDG